MAQPPTHAQKHSARLRWPRPNASLNPFALKTCSQHAAFPRARASLGRASNLSPIKMHHIERCTGPEWRAHAHARRNAPHACFGHAKSVPRALCSRHMVLAMAGMAPLSSHSACNSCLSDPPLTHYQNAPCQAVYGPGVEAAQVNTFLTRAFGIRHTQTHAGIPLALHSKRCLQHGTVDSARSSRAHQSPPTSRRSKCTMTSVAPALNGASMCTHPARKRLVCMV